MSQPNALWRALPGLLLAVLLVVVGSAMVATGRYDNDRAFGVTIVCTGITLLLFGPLVLPRRPPPLAPDAPAVPGWRLPRILLGIGACLMVAAAVSAVIGTALAAADGTGRGITWRFMPVVMVPLALALVAFFLRGGGRHRLLVEDGSLVHEYAGKRDAMALADIADVRMIEEPAPAFTLSHRSGLADLTLHPRHFDASPDDLRRWIDHQKVRS